MSTHSDSFMCMQFLTLISLGAPLASILHVAHIICRLCKYPMDGEIPPLKLRLERFLVSQLITESLGRWIRSTNYVRNRVTYRIICSINSRLWNQISAPYIVKKFHAQIRHPFVNKRTDVEEMDPNLKQHDFSLQRRDCESDIVADDSCPGTVHVLIIKAASCMVIGVMFSIPFRELICGINEISLHIQQRFDCISYSSLTHCTWNHSLIRKCSIVGKNGWFW